MSVVYSRPSFIFIIQEIVWRVLRVVDSNWALVTRRFNLLLLDEGEIYFDDFAAVFYPSEGSDEDSLKRRVEGRLKLCSASVFFVPKVCFSNGELMRSFSRMANASVALLCIQIRGS